MKNFKKYIAEQLVGQRLHFKCNCIFPMDHVGIIKDYEIYNNEILFLVDMGDRIIRIGENHPNLEVENT